MANISKIRRFTVVDEGVLGARSRADFVFENLRDAIADGHIGRGQRVREEEVGRNLGVSRTPVREALQRLQQRGLLAITGRGLVVAELTQQQVAELYSMREILEGLAARFAAERASAHEIAVLYRLQKELRDSKNDPQLLVTMNRHFHRAIYEAAHNRYLMQTLDHLHDSFALLQNTTFRPPSRRKISDEEHRRIVAAIERRDPDRAEAAAREHIRQAQFMRLQSPVAPGRRAKNT